MSLRCFRWPAVLMLALNLQACYTWRPSPLSVAEAMADDPGEIRITTADGTRWRMREPRLVGDSLTTVMALAYCPPDRSDPCTATQVNGMPTRPMPLAEVALVELKEFSGGRTVGAVALTLTAAMALLAIVGCAGDDFC